jgi:hypothetical protein
MDQFRRLLDSPGLHVSYDVANSWLYNEWKGMHDAASIKLHVEGVFMGLAQQPCTKILSDHSDLLGYWEGAAPWVGPHYFDRLARQGIRYFAWVYAPGTFDRVAMERSCYHLNRPVVAIFNDLASAYDWLRRCPPQSLGVRK